MAAIKYSALEHLASMASLKVDGLFSVVGKVVVVTGGSRGIGLMMCKAYVENGAKVYVVSRKKEACDSVAAALNALPTKHARGVAVSLPADVGSDANCKALATKLATMEEKVHVLVNNAGITWGDSFNDFPEDAWDKVLRLNVTSIFNLTRAFVPLLKEASNGNMDPSSVINVSSVAGNVDSSSPFDNAPSYAASKAAANKLTQSLAAFLVKHNINVNCIAPAVFPSKMTFNYQLKTEELADMMKKSHPVGRYGCAEDMAGLTLFLSTRASAFVTGSIIRLDGGTSAIARM